MNRHEIVFFYSLCIQETPSFQCRQQHAGVDEQLLPVYFFYTSPVFYESVKEKAYLSRLYLSIERFCIHAGNGTSARYLPSLLTCPSQIDLSVIVKVIYFWSLKRGNRKKKSNYLSHYAAS